MIIKFTRNLKNYDLDVIGFYKKTEARSRFEANRPRQTARPTVGSGGGKKKQ